MGERWQAKYGRKKTQPTKSKAWLRKYGPQFDLIDFDPNQPRDDRGRWTSGGGGSGGDLFKNRDYSKMSRGELDELVSAMEEIDMSETQAETYNRAYAEFMKKDISAVKILGTQKTLTELRYSKYDAKGLQAAHDQIEYLKAKYPTVLAGAVNFTPPPPGGNPGGWVNSAGDEFSYGMEINVNHNFKTQAANLARHADNEMGQFPEHGTRYMKFNQDKLRTELAQQGFDLDAFLAKHPDYKSATGYTVFDKSRGKDVGEYVKGVITHEFGHVMHLGSGAGPFREITSMAKDYYENDKRAKLLSEYAQLNHLETWAEAFMMYENHPAIAEDLLPGPLIGYIKGLQRG